MSSSGPYEFHHDMLKSLMQDLRIVDQGDRYETPRAKAERRHAAIVAAIEQESAYAHVVQTRLGLAHSPDLGQAKMRLRALI